MDQLQDQASLEQGNPFWTAVDDGLRLLFAFLLDWLTEATVGVMFLLCGAAITVRFIGGDIDLVPREFLVACAVFVGGLRTLLSYAQDLFELVRGRPVDGGKL